MGDAALCDRLFVDDDDFHYHSDADDLFRILETWEDCVSGGAAAASPIAAAGGQLLRRTVAPPPGDAARSTMASRNNKRPRPAGNGDGGVGRDAPGLSSPLAAQKRQKLSSPALTTAPAEDAAASPKATTTSHIAVERNRRKQMNENLVVLRSLMPCFYVKRGDQASIIGGVVDYIKELQQVLHSLEAKKQRKAYTDHAILSPRPPPPPSCCSPRPPLSPRPPPPLLKYSATPPLSPRLTVTISPRTPPTPGSPYKLCWLPPPPPPPSASGSNYVSPAMTPTSHEQAAAAAAYLPSLDAIAAELSVYANKQALVAPAAGVLPDVKVEFAGANLVLKTVAFRAPGQAVKIIAALEGRSLEILQAKISTVDDTAVNSFTVKIGIECELSAEELVHEIQQTFS